ncbi:MarR family transcriptional regulator [Arenibaculum sp.]|uniref:MarR family winged helix-turn-helix transcriptional regulator n=1 Tax=Arenibaculum sp. TaxID=2865862 RepID=UPI002E0FD2EC|nr:MarR family transcriptional regulator [Arenibaculum sp.]
MSDATSSSPDAGPDGGKTRGRRGALRRSLLPGLVGYRLRKAQIAMFQSFQAAVAPHEVTPGQFGLLVLIRENTGLSQSRLGAAVGIDRSTMVAAIDRLEGRGWVVRAPSPTDRRSYALRLGPEGERLLDELIPKVRAHEEAMLAGMDAGERRLLLDLLGRLAGGG